MIHDLIERYHYPFEWRRERHEHSFWRRLCPFSRFTGQRQSDNTKMNMKGATKLRLAIVTVIDGVLSITATPCTVISPACDLTVFDVPPIEFTISLDEAVDSTTVSASDFTVNRIKAASSTVIN